MGVSIFVIVPAPSIENVEKQVSPTRVHAECLLYTKAVRARCVFNKESHCNSFLIS